MAGQDGNDALSGESATGVVVALGALARPEDTASAADPIGLGLSSESLADLCIGVENILGSKGSDILVGNTRRNVIEGGRGDDIILGAAGRDAFLYRPGDGHDLIADFTLSGIDAKEHDTIRFVGTRLKSFTDLMKSSIQIEEGVVVEISRTESVTLVGARVTLLKAADFDFL